MFGPNRNRRAFQYSIGLLGDFQHVLVDLDSGRVVPEYDHDQEKKFKDLCAPGKNFCFHLFLSFYMHVLDRKCKKAFISVPLE
jgi:hypothetical protein